MFILELGQIIDVLVNDNPKVVGLVMRGDVGLGERFGHDVSVKGR
jgi:hypothetical protein